MKAISSNTERFNKWKYDIKALLWNVKHGMTITKHQLLILMEKEDIVMRGQSYNKRILMKKLNDAIFWFINNNFIREQDKQSLTN